MKDVKLVDNTANMLTKVLEFQLTGIMVAKQIDSRLIFLSFYSNLLKIFWSSVW